ncbi:glycine betaine ABC transporter substrate-binding protein [Candidatus Formimonas warabiya]|uniref:glycine betaine ABC transporter substrate-binding protein n=1 Tax=Formimonas warabiya TaxID=1761012 RepID=UPI001BE4BD9F|nr:glycine betaine ABC transporter substrate-binding protein [Candidatus Formimonas warabiya]
MSRIKRKNTLIMMLVTTLLAFYLSGCSQHTQGKIKIAVVDWPESLCMTELIKVILENEMNYQVEVKPLKVDDVFQSLAEGRCDIFLDCWLPITHEKFIYQYGSQIENLGDNFAGARTGLVVPAYVTINSITQLNDEKDAFHRTIIGIEPEAGIIKSTQKAIKEYGLDFRLITSSSPEMVEKLKNAIDRKEWIVVTGWSPHWKFAKWDLKFLDDPLFIYGGAESLHTVTRKGFADDFPQVAQFLYNFQLDQQQLDELLLIQNDSSQNREESMTMWAEKNKKLVDAWLSNIQ